MNKILHSCARSALCLGAVLSACLVLAPQKLQAADRVFESEKARFRVSEVVSGLDHPWGMVFLPGGEILVTERSGDLRIIRNGKLLAQPVRGLPEIDAPGQGGLLGITLHPDFDRNHLLYLAYTGEQDGAYGTEVLRGRLEGDQLLGATTIFRALPKASGGRHFGARLLFADDNTLYLSLGDRGFKPSLCRAHPAQHTDSHLGALIRINDDGSLPRDNPFISRPDARPEIFTYGHRNIQGMAVHPRTRQIWTHEHGPQGGDEINIIRPGNNYGWPVITYGVNYGTGTRICEGGEQPGMEQPNYTWVPSIAPSGMTFYTGDSLPAWQGNLFVGSLKFGLLVRLELQGDRVVHEERLLDNAYGRIRDVVTGPDGSLYLLTDASPGSMLRISGVD